MCKKVLCMIAALVMLFCAVGCEAGQPQEQMPEEEIPVGAGSGMRKTVVYMEDANGFLVPVTKEIEWSENMQMNALEALREPVGVESLSPVLPPDADMALFISDGLAVVDMSENALDAPDAVAEANKVMAVVNTLTGFENVNSVLITVEGENGVKLKNGTDLSEPFSAFDLNPQKGKKEKGLEEKAELYFPSGDESHIVPITRYFSREPDVEAAVNELIAGPGVKALKNAFPEGTRLVSYDIDGSNTLTLNFSEEFGGLADGGDEIALETLYLTCLGFDNVEDVDILINGRQYEGAASVMALPEYPNNF